MHENNAPQRDQCATIPSRILGGYVRGLDFWVYLLVCYCQVRFPSV